MRIGNYIIKFYDNNSSKVHYAYADTKEDAIRMCNGYPFARVHERNKSGYGHGACIYEKYGDQIWHC